MRGGGRAAEFQRVGQDAGQHHPLDSRRCAVKVVADQVVHDRGGAGQRPDGDVDRGAGGDAAGQQMVVDDFQHLGLRQRGGQFRGVVGVHNHALVARGHVLDDFGHVHAPFAQHPQRLGVGRALQHRFRRGLADIRQIPRPDQWRAGGIGVGGLVAENLDHRTCSFMAESPALIGAWPGVVKRGAADPRGRPGLCPGCLKTVAGLFPGAHRPGIFMAG